MKKTSAALALLMALSTPALAEIQGSDEQFYALFIAAIEQCGDAYPEAKLDYGRVRTALDRVARGSMNADEVLKSPTLSKTLIEARREMAKLLAGNEKKWICDDLKHGRIGQISLPVDPNPK